MAATYGGAAAPGGAVPPILTERFSDRARALFYARLAFLGIALAVLAIPSWSELLGTTSAMAFVVYFAVIGYSVANYLLIDHPKWGRTVTFVTLVLDLGALSLLAVASGGLKSPVMAAHVMLTIFFALLFPRFRSLIPALVLLPIVAQIDLAMNRGPFFSQGLFFIGWYGTLALVAAYVILYLNARDERRTRQLRALTQAQEQAIITEERLRLAREIHDGLGGSLSTLIIQSEFILRSAKEPETRKEVNELKAQAEEAIDELRRSLTMMRRDFDLHKAFQDYCERFEERTKVRCTLSVAGRVRRLPSEMQLTLFRILQEGLTNISKHASASNADVKLNYDGDLTSITVSDNGVGFHPGESRKGHYGIDNIEARSQKFRGTVEINSAPGAGTVLHVTLVIPAEGSHVALMPVG